MSMVLHHIGIACKDIQIALEDMRRTHDVVGTSDIVYDSLQDAHLCMVHTRNGVTYELISGGQVERLVKKQITYYHVCYAVADLDRSLAEFTANGAILCSPPKPAELFNGRRVAFVLTGFGMVELLEEAGE